MGSIDQMSGIRSATPNVRPANDIMTSLPEPRVVVALDYPSPLPALALADRLDPKQCALKVGKELFVTAGPEPVRWLIDRGFRVFLDLKFHDIPNTVAQGAAAATRLGVWMFTVHASGGRAMLAATREAVDRTAKETGGPRPMIVAVTVLTSLDDRALQELRWPPDTAGQALHLARLAAESGIDGAVCSAVEAPLLRQNLGPAFKLVTPGIRPQGSAAGDQARVITPEQAIANGADYLVIGRPITQAADPLAALTSINHSLGVAS